MCSLATFPIPAHNGYVTVCETNGELLAVPEDTYDEQSTTQSLNYPVVTLSTDSRRSLSTESAKSAFLEHKETLWKRIMSAWYEDGTTGALEEVANSKDIDMQWLSKIACWGLGGVRWWNSLHGWYSPHLVLSSEDMTAEFSTNRDWSKSDIRCFAWHPHTVKFAVVFNDDSIKVYSSGQDIVPTLKHKAQKGVATVAWKPLSASVLAVACQTCVLIWHVDPTSLATRPSTSSVQILMTDGHTPVTSLAWSPHGDLLLSASPADTAMMVWDIAMETCVPLRRYGGGGVSSLSWSPDGTKVFAGTPSSLFRVWECQKWSCEKWTNLSGKCQAACWSPDGATVLFTTADDPIIYSLSFSLQLDESRPVIGGSQSAVSCIDLSEVCFECDDREVKIGGTAKHMIWDPTGERLAVTFKNNCNGSEYIAVYRTKLHPVLEIMPCGFIKGKDGELPNDISFQNEFKDGALLTVVWSSGRVSHIPLIYIHSDQVNNEHMHNNKLRNGNGHMNNTILYTEH
ncbi:unnamed protein product [Owenia fusiformis]|uniref:Aladin seven-bladed propeller domain-containing protein n=1 Tax=Owenia fusiformis TaxID=6347 RepID=A0A8J1Y431_OWEFU|nr:unnamed protein product [Owenia fusiformis]